jgi:hypothetical protein
MRRDRGGFTPKQRGCSLGPRRAVASREGGFTLAELLVSVFVVTIIILMVTQLMTSATAITRTGNKHVDTDTQARAVLDRMALDFAQMLKRTDVDYYVKGPTNYAGHGNGHGWGHHPPPGQLGSDQIAFFSEVLGYSPTSGAPSSISLVSYRVNQGASTGNPAYLRLERMGKRLIWNGTPPSGNDSNNPKPMVFLPLTIGPSATDSSGRWPTATSGIAADSDYETIGQGVFRFEYYYLLKNGKLTDVPWNTDAGHTSLAGIGLTDVESIAVAIAVIDPAGRALIDAASPTSLLDLAADLDDFATAPGRGVGGAHRIGDLEYRWKGVLFGDASVTPALPGVVNTGLTGNGTPIPPEAVKSIRIYNRYFDLKSL